MTASEIWATQKKELHDLLGKLLSFKEVSFFENLILMGVWVVSSKCMHTAQFSTHSRIKLKLQAIKRRRVDQIWNMEKHHDMWRITAWSANSSSDWKYEIVKKCFRIQIFRKKWRWVKIHLKSRLLNKDTHTHLKQSSLGWSVSRRMAVQHLIFCQIYLFFSWEIYLSWVVQFVGKESNCGGDSFSWRWSATHLDKLPEQWNPLDWT